VIVLDSSAILAIAFQEPGADKVIRAISQGILSAANLAEVLIVAERNRLDGEAIYAELLALGLRIAPVTQTHARVAGQIWRAHPKLNLSLGDRLCLALGFGLRAEVMTSDREMTKVGMGLMVSMFR
jgi:ribonuclease VapC